MLDRSPAFSFLVADRELICPECGNTFTGWHKRKYCSLRCAVDSRILILGDDECWPWKGGVFQKDGYGRVAFLEIEDGAHRIAYMEHVGPIPDGLVVRHSCDNPICCNYKTHLLLGTPKDNKTDSIVRGRDCRGERHHSAKLNPSVVVRIRTLHSEGRSFASLAMEFGCSDVSIQRLVVRRTWRGVA